MLLQRALCRGWHSKLTKTPPWNTQNSHQHKNGLTNHCTFHHSLAKLRPRQFALLQSFRATTRNLRPPRATTTLQAPRAPQPPFENLTVGGSVPPRNVIKALVFASAFSVGCFMGATIMEYENTRNMMLEKARQAKLPWIRRRLVSDIGAWQKLKNEINHFWEQLTPGEKVFVPLCALNLLVFCMWRVPSLRPTMMTYFCSNPAGRAVCWPMFLSTFSHYSAFHIFANMYVLHSFSNAAVLSLGKEQFLGVYLSAGVIASFTSILYKAATVQSGLSIGASGAIMAILAYVCSKYPDTQLNILFLPMLTFSAGSAIKVIMGLDLAGCIMGWKFFDHAAHLGGAMFGVFWAFFGNDMWQKRIPFLTMYHDFRKTK